ncbi:MAG: excinuclease ABC subunit UvrA [Candidatus Helarchaeota archaeon]
MNKLVIKGAREHNLKNFDLEIPRDKFIVITGISGSGKSSLAFDTIYAEGQRRYVESLSAYARQFLGKMLKPDVESIEGLSPAIAIEQRALSHNPRSTVGTVTEIYDYLRLLFARIGRPHCHLCGRPIARQTVQEIVDQVLSFERGSRIIILSPQIRGRKGHYAKLFQDLKKKGFVRVRVDGEIIPLASPIKLDKNKKHDIEIVVDRLVISEEVERQLTDAIETALNFGNRVVSILVLDQNDPRWNKELIFSENLACVHCGISFEELNPRNFSFNTPFGSCPVCEGLGVKKEIDMGLLIPDDTLSINQGAISALGENRNTYFFQMVRSVAEHYNIDLDKPFRELTKKERDIILNGSPDIIHFKLGREGENVYEFRRKYEGVINNMQRRYRETKSEWSRELTESFMQERTCPACNGNRLRPESLSVRIGKHNIMDLCHVPLIELPSIVNEIKLNDREKIIAKDVLKEIKNRIQFLLNVGLGYITLDRMASTLSAGESQRIHLATQIGSNLVGVLYVLDEPSIGLHARDNERLLNTLEKLRDLGNTVLVVEHDHATIERSDFVIDLGPGAGENGGYVVVAGSPEDVKNCEESITGRFLSGKEEIEIPAMRRKALDWIEIRGARHHNLKNITVKIPLGVFTCVTGVSGAGKSTLINDILYNQLASEINDASLIPGDHDVIVGTEKIDKIINITQAPIGRTTRSNPATYSKVWDEIRKVFAEIKESKLRGYKPGRFSFNVQGGRCEACQGDGLIKIDLVFLAPVFVPCEVCKGAKYNRETLEIKFKEKSIADVLNMSVDEALDFFSAYPKIRRILQTLQDVGLGYIKLGQSSPVLSGGEAQRVKLARELSKRSTGRTLYLLDEPTTGLSTYDIKKLLNVLQVLVDKGNTVLVIEHNLDVIKSADYIIDLGPEGGTDGGQVVATGTPEEVSKTNTHTGRFLKKIIQSEKLSNPTSKSISKTQPIVRSSKKSKPKKKRKNKK